MRTHFASPTRAVAPDLPLRAAGQGSRFSQVPAGAPRALEAGRNSFTAKAERLINRVLNWATPHGLRAHPKILAGRQATDAHVRTLLNTISFRPEVRQAGERIRVQSDREAIIGLLKGLDATMEPMTSRPTETGLWRPDAEAGDTEFKSSVERNLKGMARDELFALQEGLEHIDLLVPAGPLRKRATLVQEALTAELRRPLDETVKANLDFSMSQTLSEDPVPRSADISISKDMWLELNRADFTVDGKALIDKSQPAGDLDTIRLDALRQLKAETGINDAQLMALSRVTHQGAMGFVAQPGFAANSPLRLPDGTPCMPMGRGSLSFDIRKDDQGNVRVFCRNATNLTHLIKPDGKQVTLEKGAVANFEYEVTITAEGTASVSTPLKTQFQAKPDEWSAKHNKPYPKPTSADDLFGTKESAALRTDMRQYVSIVQYTPENFDFLDGLGNFAEGPDKKKAQALHDEYTKLGAPSQLNLSDGDLKKVQEKMDRWDDMTPTDQSALFNETRIALQTLMWDNKGAFLENPNHERLG